MALFAVALLVAASVMAAVASIQIGSGAADTNPQLRRNLVVDAYFGAVNHMIESGDPAPLRAVLGAEFLDVTLSGVETRGSADLERHIAFVRRVATEAYIEPQALFADGDTMLVRVTVVLPAPAGALGLSVDDQAALWPASEELRIEHGSIVERRANWSDRFRITSMEAARLDAGSRWDGTLKAGIDHFPPQSRLTLRAGEIPALLRVLTGRFTVILAPQQPMPAVDIELESFGVPPGTNARPNGHPIVLFPEEVFVVPAGSIARLSNPGLVEASMLRLAHPSAVVTGELSHDTARSSTGVRTSTIASAVELGFGEAMGISWGEVLLTPGAGIVVDNGNSIFMVCANASIPRCASADNLAAEQGFVRIGQGDPAASRTPPVLLLMQENGGPILMNAGQTLTSLWILAVSPVHLTA